LTQKRKIRRGVPLLQKTPELDTKQTWGLGKSCTEKSSVRDVSPQLDTPKNTDFGRDAGSHHDFFHVLVFLTS